jgi:hypothetical protein
MRRLTGLAEAGDQHAAEDDRGDPTVNE